MRYFFNVRDGDELVEDPEGIVLPDPDSARREAINGARSLLCRAVLAGRLPLSDAIVVNDERGRIVDIVRFGSVVAAS